MKQIWQQEQERGHAVVLFSQLCTRIGLARHAFSAMKHIQFIHIRGKGKMKTYFTFWRVLNQTHVLDLTAVSAGIVETASPVERRIQNSFHLGGALTTHTLGPVPNLRFFKGTFNSIQILRVPQTHRIKVCMECYRHSLVVSKINKDNPISNDPDFYALLSAIQKTVDSLPFSITNNHQLLDIATKLTVIQIAQKLLSNHALTLRDAYCIFES